MALRKTLGEIVDAVRHEARISTNSSFGADHLEYIKQKVARNYALLTDDYEWNYLELDRTQDQAGLVTVAGENVYDFPAMVDGPRAESLWVRWGEQWVCLVYGISLGDYNAFDPSLDSRAEQPLKWAHKGVEQFEIWPMPASDGIEMRFEGPRLPEPIVNESSRLDVDFELITLVVAAEILGSGPNMKEYQIVAQRADRRLAQCKAKYSGKKVVSMSGGRQQGRRPLEIKYVRG